MLKIYDCSNSTERPSHRKISYCPVENTIVADLKKYANQFDSVWVTNPSDADVLFTNDVFPREFAISNTRKVKRMDGIFQLNHLKERNEVLNESAKMSDHVIFISEFSKQSYIKLYGNNIKSNNVILNTVDDRVFYNVGIESKKIVFSACCSNWERPEKRFSSLMMLARHIPNTIHLIGYCPLEVPKNVIKQGYIEDERMLNTILNTSNAFINLSYKDACPKTVSQAVACGLPVLYANSGGVPEQVKYGSSISENAKIGFDDDIPKIHIRCLGEGYLRFITRFKLLSETARQHKTNHLETLSNYYKTIKGEIK